MTYTLKYAKMEGIQRRIVNRLYIQGQTIPTIPQTFGSSLGAQQVNQDLILDIAASVESQMDTMLALQYVLPIAYTATDARYILASIAEKWIISEVIPTHLNETQNAKLGGDSHWGATLRADYILELERYTVAWGIYLKGGQTSQGGNRQGNQIVQPVALPGVKFREWDGLGEQTHRSIQPYDAIAVSRTKDQAGSQGRQVIDPNNGLPNWEWTGIGGGNTGYFW